MTRPSEIKPREGDTPGTRAKDFRVGAELPEVKFAITPEIVQEYVAAIDGDLKAYRIKGRQAAPPNVLTVYLLAILYREYPPEQGIILTHQTWTWRAPIWADETTHVVAHGRILDRFNRHGKNYLKWSAEFRRLDGTPLASATNTMYVPR